MSDCRFSSSAVRTVATGLSTRRWRSCNADSRCMLANEPETCADTWVPLSSFLHTRTTGDSDTRPFTSPVRSTSVVLFTPTIARASARTEIPKPSVNLRPRSKDCWRPNREMSRRPSGPSGTRSTSRVATPRRLANHAPTQAESWSRGKTKVCPLSVRGSTSSASAGGLERTPEPPRSSFPSTFASTRRPTFPRSLASFRRTRDRGWKRHACPPP